MAIKTRLTQLADVFDEADMFSGTGAKLHARFSYSVRNFFVSTSKEGVERKEPGVDGWWFDEDSCREAVEFFTKLANELMRRRIEDDFPF